MLKKAKTIKTFALWKKNEGQEKKKWAFFHMDRPKNLDFFWKKFKYLFGYFFFSHERKNIFFFKFVFFYLMDEPIPKSRTNEILRPICDVISKCTRRYLTM